MADARDLKSREIFSRTGSTPASGTNNIAGWSSLVARRAHNPKVVRFKSHSRNQKRFHSRYNFGYGILLYIRKMPIFRPKTAIFSSFEGVFSIANDKSAILCPDKIEAADFVSFKGSIVHRINVEKYVEIWYNMHSYYFEGV